MADSCLAIAKFGARASGCFGYLYFLFFCVFGSLGSTRNVVSLMSEDMEQLAED